MQAIIHGKPMVDAPLRATISITQGMNGLRPPDHGYAIPHLEEGVPPRDDKFVASADHGDECSIGEIDGFEFSPDELPVRATVIKGEHQESLISEQRFLELGRPARPKPLGHEDVLIDTASQRRQNSQVPPGVVFRTRQEEHGAYGVFGCLRVRIGPVFEADAPRNPRKDEVWLVNPVKSDMRQRCAVRYRCSPDARPGHEPTPQGL